MPAADKSSAKSSSSERPAKPGATTQGPCTLAVDIGGSHVKASVLDREGRMLHEQVRVETPKNLTPERLVTLIWEMVRALPPFDRVSVGFPGVVRDGVVRTAVNLGEEAFEGFDLAGALERRFGKPVRVENDADVQGLGVVQGKGVEMVITLGTGFGTSIFVHGKLGPHLELAHHCFHGDKTYEDELGEAARRRHGNQHWLKQLRRAIESLRALTSFDRLYIGGGNARLVDIDLPPDVSIVPNTAGILGGIRLWA